ncbi:LytTR family DNA-binding domain-containing protein [Diplocloster modestus]|uniref:LytTR family transcriptional regulator n=1 Tax=Diplocloster modestus TaxID=2850322 RepID=A0ABS6K932_9FIRM|nr:LytTR family DNA-binding domain-containing protein [Diplocloster modestus]MBU9727023.1 LytTR family transcriptional regulator [Diplocloster modestus]
MQIEIKIDRSYKEPRIIVLTDSLTEEVSHILKKLSEDVPQIISGNKNEKIEVLEQAELIRIYANTGKVFAVTEKGEYTLRLRLYEIEERLNTHQFVRISNSEIINLKKVNNFDLSLTGTICVRMSNGTTTYVSRRYVSKIKKILGI